MSSQNKETETNTHAHTQSHALTDSCVGILSVSVYQILSPSPGWLRSIVEGIYPRCHRVGLNLKPYEWEENFLDQLAMLAPIIFISAAILQTYFLI